MGSESGALTGRRPGLPHPRAANLTMAAWLLTSLAAALSLSIGGSSPAECKTMHPHANSTLVTCHWELGSDKESAAFSITYELSFKVSERALMKEIRLTWRVGFRE